MDFWIFEFFNFANQIIQAKLAAQLALPRGAVIPFNLDECPSGWKEFEAIRGRFPLGAEAGVGVDGGSATSQLGVEHMPNHDHGYRTTDTGRDRFRRLRTSVHPNRVDRGVGHSSFR